MVSIVFNLTSDQAQPKCRSLHLSKFALSPKKKKLEVLIHYV